MRRPGGSSAIEVCVIRRLSSWTLPNPWKASGSIKRKGAPEILRQKLVETARQRLKTTEKKLISRTLRSVEVKARSTVYSNLVKAGSVGRSAADDYQSNQS